MKIGIMQPYFLPYIGYWQLISAVDKFVVYDNIEFTKKGWINRNRMLVNGRPQYFTIPIKKDSDFLTVNSRLLANNYYEIVDKNLRIIHEQYKKAKYYNEVIRLIHHTFNRPFTDLFSFVFSSIVSICEFLDIQTPLIIASTLKINNDLKGKEKVKAIIKALDGDIYINPIGGTSLYDKNDFKSSSIELFFLKARKIEYQQFNYDFVPWLSILDIIMFNSKDEIKEILKEYDLL